jgi:hypothetical protein
MLRLLLLLLPVSAAAASPVSLGVAFNPADASFAVLVGGAPLNDCDLLVQLAGLLADVGRVDGLERRRHIG